jgi:hypothetical protein
MSYVVFCHGSFDGKHWTVPPGKTFVYLADSGEALDSTYADMVCTSTSVLADLLSGRGVVFEAGQRMSADLLDFTSNTFASGVYVLPLPVHAAHTASHADPRSAAIQKYLQTKHSLISDHTWKGRLSELMESRAFRNVHGIFYLSYCRVAVVQDYRGRAAQRAVDLVWRSHRRNRRSAPIGRKVRVGTDRKAAGAMAELVNVDGSKAAASDAATLDLAKAQRRLQSYYRSNPTSPYFTRSKGFRVDSPLDAHLVNATRDGWWELRTWALAYER